MANLSKKAKARFGDIDGIDEKVLRVHHEHLRNHPYVEKYDSAGEYFENEVGVSNVADGYYRIPVYSAFRIHSYAQRDYLLLQKNPNLPPDWVKSNVHWSYKDLTGELAESVQMNSLQTSKTVAGYFNDKDTVRLGLKCIIDAVQSELNCGFKGNALRQSDYENYLQLEAGRAYRNNREGSGAELRDGFYADFAYTNRCKFQATKSDGKPLEADDEWLVDELDAIAPNVVFALGDPAYEGLRNIGFKKTRERSQYSDKKTGRVLRYEGDQPNLNGTYAIHLYHLNYRDALTTDLDVHEAVRLMARDSDPS